MTGAAFWSQLQQAAVNTLASSCCSLFSFSHGSCHFSHSQLLPPPAMAALASVTGQPGTAPSSHRARAALGTTLLPHLLPSAATPVSHTAAKLLGPDKAGYSGSLFTLILALHGFIVHEEQSSKTKGRRPAFLIYRLHVHWYQKHPGGISITSLPTWAKPSRA